MIVRVKKHHLQYFRNKARQTNNEIFAYLLGFRVSPTLIQIEKLFYPELEESTPEFVKTDPQSDLEAEEVAKLNDWTIVGILHSHPNWTSELSPSDLCVLKNSTYTTSGVVSILRDRTYVKFWVKDSPLVGTIEYF